MKRILFYGSALVALIGSLYAYYHLKQPLALPNSSTDSEKQYYEASPRGFNGMTNIPLDVMSQWEAYDAKLAANGGAQSKLENITEIGPFNVGGRTRAIMIDQSDPCQYFAGGITGGLWISEDCGKHWRPVDDHASSLAVSSIVQDPQNHNKIYYGTGEVNNQFIGNGIYHSADGGKTFNNLASSSLLQAQFVIDMVHSKSDANTLFVATESGLNRLEINAGSPSSTKVIGVANQITDVEDLGNNIVIASTSSGKIFRSTDGGRTFPTQSEGIAGNGVRIKTAYSRSQPSIVYAAVVEEESLFNGLYKSVDFGAVFTKVSDLSTEDLLDADELDADETTGKARRQLEYNLEIAVHPENPDQVLLGYVILRYSPDGGISWRKVSAGHYDQHKVVFPNETQLQNDFLIGNDGGVYKQHWNNLQEEPEDLNNGFRVTQFYAGTYYPEGANHLVMGGAQDNGNIKISGSLEENRILGGDGAYAAISQTNPNVAFFTGNGGLYRLNNGDEPNAVVSEVSVIDNILFTPPLAMDPTDDQIIYYLTNGVVWRTSDQGKLWKAVTNDYQKSLSGDAHHITIAKDGSEAYAIVRGHLFIIQADDNPTPGNETQVPVTSTSPDAGSLTKVRIDPLDPDALFVIGGNSVYHVTDIHSSTPNFTLISVGLPGNMPVYDVAIDPENPSNIFVGTYYGIYFTQDQGNNWLKEEGIPYVPCQHLEIRPTDNKLFVFTHGRGIWTANISKKALFPYLTSFEDNIVGSEWNASLGSNSTLVHADEGLHKKKRVIFNKKNDQQAATAVNSLSIDLSHREPAPGEELFFSFLYTSKNDHQQSNVKFSSDGGKTLSTINLHDLRPTVLSSTENEQDTGVPVTVNLSKMAEKYGISFTDESAIVFRHQADASSTSHGKTSYDMVRLFHEKTRYATVPYVLDFDKNQITDANPLYKIPGEELPYVVNAELSDVPTDKAFIMQGKGYKEMRVLLDVSDGRRNLQLDFSRLTKALYNDPGKNAGVFLRNPMIPISERRIYTFPSGNTVWDDVSINLEAIIKDNFAHFSDDYLEIIFRGSSLEKPAIALDNIQVRENYIAAELPYATGFESSVAQDQLDPYWTALLGEGGKMGVKDMGIEGKKALGLEASGKFGTQQAQLHLNLKDIETSKISFRAKLKDYGDILEDTRVLLYDATQPDQLPVVVLDEIPRDHIVSTATISLNLVEEAQKHGLSLSEDFVVIIETECKQPLPQEGLIIDNVSVRADLDYPLASLPYATDFSGGADEHWELQTNTGRAEVIDWDESLFNDKVLALHGNIFSCDNSKPSDFSHNYGILHVAIPKDANTKLQFYYRNYGNEDNDDVSGVYLATYGNQGATKVYDFTSENQIGEWTKVELDLDALIRQYKIPLSPKYIMFKVASYHQMHFSQCRDGIAIDQVLVYNEDETQTLAVESLPKEPYSGSSNPGGFAVQEDNSNGTDFEARSLTFTSKDHTYIGLRFPRVEIPKGAIVTKAYVQFTNYTPVFSTKFAQYYLFADARANPPTFHQQNVRSRVDYDEMQSVIWNPGYNWYTKGDRYSNQRTSDLDGLIHRTVHLNDWQFGNPMVLMMTGGGSLEHRVYGSYKTDLANPQKGPTLHIEYIVDNQPPTYCKPTANNGQAWIDYVEPSRSHQNSYLHSTGKGPYNYNDYITKYPSAFYTQGDTRRLSFNAGFAGTPVDQHWKIYLDYNQDGDFDDADETIINFTGKTSYSFLGPVFTVPTHALPGLTRMRIVMSDGDSPACGNIGNGEVEDYSVFILEASGSATARIGQDQPKKKQTSGRELDLLPQKVTIFPNPVSDQFTVAFPSINEAQTLTLINMSGKVIRTLPIKADQTEAVISANDLPSGFYVLRFSHRGEVYKVVKK